MPRHWDVAVVGNPSVRRGQSRIRTRRWNDVGTKAVAVVGAVGVIWLAVLLASILAPDMVTGSQQEHLNVAALANWFWGLLSTMFLLRATVFRPPRLERHEEEAVWIWSSVAVGGVWLAVAVISIFTPAFVTGSDPTRLPLAAILAPIVATAIIRFASEFVAQWPVKT
jgi:hypothetical protein